MTARRRRRTLLSGEALASQVEIHAPWGGVVPNLAQEAHKEAIDGVIEAALAKAGVKAAAGSRGQLTRAFASLD